MSHLKPLTRESLPQYANDSIVCGRHRITGQVKCVPTDDPQASKIEIIPVP